MTMTEQTEPEADPRRICVTVGMKVNLGNYESADASVCLSGVPVGASDETIDEMLGTSKIVFRKIATQLQEKLAGLRAELKEAR